MQKEYDNLERMIAEKEKVLLSLLDENTKKLYFEIDFLCCKQIELLRELLIKN